MGCRDVEDLGGGELQDQIEGAIEIRKEGKRSGDEKPRIY